MLILEKLSSILQRLRGDDSGVSLTEFAVVAPVFLTLGMFGFEVSNIATTKMQVSQVALSVGDNASRLGQTDNSAVIPTIREADVEAVLRGGIIQGRSIDIANKGRIVLSSLEVDNVSGKQFIHWQRCIGGLTDFESRYGDEDANNGLTGDEIVGMGRGATQITAPPGSAVMFVEIYYEYENIFPSPFGTDSKFIEEAAFLIRDDRTLQTSAEKGLNGTRANGCEDPDST